MKPTKKPELRILKKKSVTPEPPQEPLPQVDTIDYSQAIDEHPSVHTETQATKYLSNYAPVQNYPILQSVGNSGWQPSDIWRELRLDSFCD